MVTLVTLVSHSYLRWRGVTQGGVDPVFPFRANPYLCRRGDHGTAYATPPHSRTRISVAPLRERLAGTISKLGKGAALQKWQKWGAEG